MSESNKPDFEALANAVNQSDLPLVEAIEDALRDAHNAALRQAANIANEVAKDIEVEYEYEEATVAAQKDTAITIRNCIMFQTIVVPE